MFSRYGAQQALQAVRVERASLPQDLLRFAGSSDGGG
jgi:hypothetical protein